MMTKNYIVSIVVCTYNQENWIRQTLDSIVKQKTDFPFEVIIGEDYSTDNTRSICQEYVDRYDFVRLMPCERNLGVVRNWVNCVKNVSGKYLMICAGDDYWHNPNKVQIQVEYMESHPQCVICHTDFDTYYNGINKIKHNTHQKNKSSIPEGFIQNDILSGKANIIAVTQCIRKDLFDKYIPTDKFVELDFPREDWPVQLILSAYGTINYIPISTSTYRVGQESITNCHDYSKIRTRYQADKCMTEFLYSYLPELGKFEDVWWYDTYQYYSLLLAAYINNDYHSAKEFSTKLSSKKIMVIFARNYFTFKLYRLWRFILKPYCEICKL